MGANRKVELPSEHKSDTAAGILVRDRVEPVRPPVISAFIWGGKIRPVPTLPFGRWKPNAA
ncbi:MAG TPA: hypothetical protein VF212_06625 [Longimicrobiales bacterium]